MNDWNGVFGNFVWERIFWACFFGLLLLTPLFLLATVLYITALSLDVAGNLTRRYDLGLFFRPFSHLHSRLVLGIGFVSLHSLAFLSLLLLPYCFSLYIVRGGGGGRGQKSCSPCLFTLSTTVSKSLVNGIESTSACVRHARFFFKVARKRIVELSRNGVRLFFSLRASVARFRSSGTS